VAGATGGGPHCPDCIRRAAARGAHRRAEPERRASWQNNVLEPLSGYLWLGACLPGPSSPPADRGPPAAAFNFGPPLASIRPVEALVKESPARPGDGKIAATRGRCMKTPISVWPWTSVQSWLAACLDLRPRSNNRRLVSHRRGGRTGHGVQPARAASTRSRLRGISPTPSRRAAVDLGGLNPILLEKWTKEDPAARDPGAVRRYHAAGRAGRFSAGEDFVRYSGRHYE